MLTILLLGACSQGSNPAETRNDADLPERVPPSTVVGTVEAPRSAEPTRVLLVGDSTLLAVQFYDTFEALQGFEYIFDAQSCRTLGVPSCGDPPIPTNAVAAIEEATGSFDIVVVMAGYDEWWTSFPSSFEKVMGAARAKGAEQTVWLTFREGVGYIAPDGSTANEAFVRNNETLRALAGSAEHPDAVIADWYAYTARPGSWVGDDGIHLTPTGALGLADYISRVIAHLEGRPCPQPWQVGAPVETVCPDPDAHGRIDDVLALYP